ncbi:MAG: DUF933 domain-containing protein [Candidatus Hydrothermia bacterium]|jgi:ribosome-binding ATPase YchF (GTP1/OBG family)
MRVAIIGESQVGKSSLLRILSDDKFTRGSGYFSGYGTFLLDDPNLDFLTRIYESEKKTPIHVEVFDFDGFGRLWKDDRKGEIKNDLAKFEAFIVVLSDSNSLNLLDTFYNIEYKLLLTDLDFVSRRLELLKKERTKKKVDEREISVLEKIENWLAEEKPLNSLELSEPEKEIIKGHIFLSLLPQIFVINREEPNLGKELPSTILEKLAQRNAAFFVTSLKIEEELISLSWEEKREILASYGIEKGIKEEISSAVIPALSVTVFYTAGKTEARAWYVEKGATAKKAAGRIHSDLERGFIRAEVINIEDLKRAGDEKRAKELGLYRLEGKDYVVKDGDVLIIRFSI